MASWWWRHFGKAYRHIGAHFVVPWIMHGSTINFDTRKQHYYWIKCVQILIITMKTFQSRKRIQQGRKCEWVFKVNFNNILSHTLYISNWEFVIFLPFYKIIFKISSNRKSSIENVILVLFIFKFYF